MAILTAEERIEILVRWGMRIRESQREIDRIIEVFNCVSCDLTDDIDRLQQAYTDAIALLVGDDDALWMNWFWLENEMGDKKHSAGYDSDIRTIRTIKDLAWLIEESKKRNG